MSRNGSGVYSLPAGNPVVTGTAISSTWANNTLTDIANALTGSLSSDGQTPLTGNLNFASTFKPINMVDPTNLQDGVTKNYLLNTDYSATGTKTFTNITYTGTLTGGTGVINLGSGQIYKDASGNVGIGTSSPGAKFAVGNNTDQVQAGISGSTSIIYFGSPNNGSGGQATLSYNRALGLTSLGSSTTGGALANSVNIDISGNLGLGTTNPLYTLDIRTASNNGLRVTDGTYSGTFVASSLGGMAITTNGAYPLITYVNGAVRTSVNATGQFTNGANGTPIVSSSDPYIQGVSNSAVGQFVAGQTSSYWWSFGRDCVSTGYFVFAPAGTIVSTINTYSGVYTALSDGRLKKNITPIQYGLKEVLALNPVMYNMKSEDDTKKKHIGLIAQEVKVVIDELVEDIDETKQSYGLALQEIVPILIKAIQELNARIVILESKK